MHRPYAGSGQTINNHRIREIYSINLIGAKKALVFDKPVEEIFKLEEGD